MSCKTYDPCLDSKLNQIGSYASVARQSAEASSASATQSANSATASATSAANSQNSANDSADSATEANNYLTQVENIFNDFDERYLGAKSTAPIVDNQGNPLQEGALYWNSVSDQMFAWNGTIWVATNFNQLTNFTATGTTASRNLVTRFADVVNVKDFGAIGNGTADDRVAFTDAIATGKTVLIPDGTYNLTTGVVISSGTLNLIGSSKDKVKLISNVGTWMFVGNMTNVQFENITFDGRRVRDVNGWPYSNPQTNNGSFRAIQATAPQGDDSTSVIIDKCDFLNFSSLPIFFYFFYNARVTNSKFYKTLDPGFVFCNNVVWSNNITEFCADNGVSMSRGNNNVIVESSIFKDCQGTGIWISGFALPGTGTVTATGASFNVLDQVTLTFSVSGQLGNDKPYVTQKSGSLEATYKIKQITSSTTAIAECINAIDPAFQGTTIATWEFGPSLGPNRFCISNNIVIGAQYGAIYGDPANANVNISNNIFARTGWCADSEIYTFGSIAISSTTLKVNNSSNFNIGDYILIDPISSQRDYFITQITNISGNTITTLTSPDVTYSNEKIYLVHTGSTTTVGDGRHIQIIGNMGGFPDANPYQISISNNIMIESAGEAIIIGRSFNNNTSKNITIRGNSIYFPANAVGPFDLNKRHALYINEYDLQAAPSKNIILTDNFYTGTGNILYLAQNSLANRQYIVCSNNTYPSGQHFYAFDILTSTNLTDNYRTSHYNEFGCLEADAIQVKTLEFGPSPWTIATVVSGVMNVKLSTLQFAGTNPTTQITEFTKGVNTDLVVFSLRNSSLTVGETITIVQDFTKIRTQTGANLVLGPGQTALFAFLNSTVVAQIG